MVTGTVAESAGEFLSVAVNVMVHELKGLAGVATLSAVCGAAAASPPLSAAVAALAGASKSRLKSELLAETPSQMTANCAEPMLFGPVPGSVSTRKGKARFTLAPEGAIEYVTDCAVSRSR